MARVAINTGASANDGTGDNLRVAGGILNNNFLELYTYLGAGSTTVPSAPLWSSTNAGINTLRNVGIGTTNPRFALEVGAVGAAGTTLFVNGDARVTGIVTIGPASITLNGITNTVNIGTGITLNGTTGIISATAIVLGGTTLTGVAVTSITAGSGISVSQSTGNVTITATGGGSSSQFVTTAAGIHTLSNVGIGTTNPTSKLTVSGNVLVSGIITASSFSGNASSATYASNAGIATYASNAGIATYATSAGIATYASNAGIATYATSAGIATNAQGLTGTPNLNVGIITATSFVGNGSGLTNLVGVGAGIVIKDSGSTVGTAGTIDFGDNLTVSAISAGIVTVTGSASGGSGIGLSISDTPPANTTTYPLWYSSLIGRGFVYYNDGSSSQWVDFSPSGGSSIGGSSQFVTTAAGIHTLSNVGIGTTNPTSKLTVTGNATFTGVVTATTFVGALTGTATTATNAQGLTGTPNITVGVVTASALDVAIGATVATIDFGQSGSLQYSQPNVTLLSSYASGKVILTAEYGIEMSRNNETVAYFAMNPSNIGYVELYYDNSKKFQTIGDGVSITGTTFTNNLSVSGIATASTLNVGTGGTVITTTTAGLVGIGTTNPVNKLQIERFGIQSGFGTFSASAGITTDIDAFTISSTNFKTVEYTLHFTNQSNIQAQKVLVMQNGTTSYSQEYAIMFEPNQIVSIGTTISSGICKLQVTPETGISGITTYRFSKETLL